MKYVVSLFLLLFANLCWGQSAKSTEYGSGFSFDNQLYALQGASVSLATGLVTHRPWVGAVSGVGSCMAFRAVHDQGYSHDTMFSSDRIAFCAVGSAGGYVINKLMHVGKKR